MQLSFTYVQYKPLLKLKTKGLKAKGPVVCNNLAVGVHLESHNTPHALTSYSLWSNSSLVLRRCFLTVGLNIGSLSLVPPKAAQDERNTNIVSFSVNSILVTHLIVLFILSTTNTANTGPIYYHRRFKVLLFSEQVKQDYLLVMFRSQNPASQQEDFWIFQLCIFLDRILSYLRPYY